MVDTNLEALQRLAQRNFGLDLNGAMRLQTGINKDLNGICQQLFGTDANSNAAKLGMTQRMGGNALVLAGTAGSFIETTDKVSLDIVGDIDIRAEFSGVGVNGLNRDIISKYTPTTNQSFEWRYNAFGFDEIVWSTTGSNALTDTDAIFGGSNVAVRFTMDVSDAGATNRILTWYRSDNGRLSGNWVVRNQKTVAGATSIFASTAVLRIGARGDGATGSNPFMGRINRVELRAGIDGTVVANPDFRFLPVGNTTFTDAAGNQWVFTGSAVIG